MKTTELQTLPIHNTASRRVAVVPNATAEMRPAKRVSNAKWQANEEQTLAVRQVGAQNLAVAQLVFVRPENLAVDGQLDLHTRKADTEIARRDCHGLSFLAWGARKGQERGRHRRWKMVSDRWTANRVVGEDARIVGDFLK